MARLQANHKVDPSILHLSFQPDNLARSLCDVSQAQILYRIEQDV